jgi:hypothetical protein
MISVLPRQLVSSLVPMKNFVTLLTGLHDDVELVWVVVRVKALGVFQSNLNVLSSV